MQHHLLVFKQHFIMLVSLGRLFRVGGVCYLMASFILKHLNSFWQALPHIAKCASMPMVQQRGFASTYSSHTMLNSTPLSASKKTPKIKEVRAYVIEESECGADYHRQPDDHWIVQEISNPMSVHPKYKAKRTR